MRVFHLLGMREDNGGVLSVIRNLQEVGVPGVSNHVVWVNEAYRETRGPALDYRRSPRVCADSFSHLEIFTGGARAYGELRRILAREDFDVLHAHTRGALVTALCAARLMNRKVIFTNHNFARRTGFYRWAARRRNLVTVFLTPNMVRHYQGERVGTDWPVISACCSERFFTEPLVARRAPGERLRLVGVGNIIRWKNWHLVLEALSQLGPNERARVEFVHYGPVPDDPQCLTYRDELQGLVRSHHLEGMVKFEGPTNSVREALGAADVFVLPSINEPCSVALIEALALGMPVIVSASGGNVDIVRPGRSGLLFEPESSASLAAELRRVLAGETRFADPAAIRESVRQRSAKAVAAAYGDLYQKVLSA